MDIALALDTLLPGAAYSGSLTENTREAFDALGWEDQRAKPDWAAVVAASTEAAKAQLGEAVNAYRDQLVAGGAPVDIGGGKTLMLDLRNEQDFRNIQALYSRALTAKLEGEADRQIRVRDSGDQEHLITVDQMIGLGKAIVDGVDAIYQASWAVKARVDAGLLTDSAGIPKAFDDVLNERQRNVF
ncbi:MAG: hypothetical protein AAFX39_12590 [Pseudomonadota bacterium]